jgi:hypothetical protein
VQQDDRGSGAGNGVGQQHTVRITGTASSRAPLAETIASSVGAL